VPQLLQREYPSTFYPLIPEKLMPSMNVFWARKKMITIGNNATTDAAIKYPHWTEYVLLKKLNPSAMV
jgi:hypothetical protein